MTIQFTIPDWVVVLLILLFTINLVLNIYLIYLKKQGKDTVVNEDEHELCPNCGHYCTGKSVFCYKDKININND